MWWSYIHEFRINATIKNGMIRKKRSNKKKNNEFLQERDYKLFGKA
jgi:hypothetical protein